MSALTITFFVVAITLSVLFIAVYLEDVVFNEKRKDARRRNRQARKR